MTQDEIIEMAKEACATEIGHKPPAFHFYLKDLEAFAKLVAAKERAACAKYVEECCLPDAYSELCLLDIAEEIRARGEA